MLASHLYLESITFDKHYFFFLLVGLLFGRKRPKYIGNNLSFLGTNSIPYRSTLSITRNRMFTVTESKEVKTESIGILKVASPVLHLLVPGLIYSSAGDKTLCINDHFSIFTTFWISAPNFNRCESLLRHVS